MSPALHLLWAIQAKIIINITALCRIRQKSVLLCWVYSCYFDQCLDISFCLSFFYFLLVTHYIGNIQVFLRKDRLLPPFPRTQLVSIFSKLDDCKSFSTTKVTILTCILMCEERRKKIITVDFVHLTPLTVKQDYP